MILKFDTCSLIYAVKTDIIGAIVSEYGPIRITVGVKEECVDRGIQHGHRDAYVIDDLIRNSKIEVIEREGASEKGLSHSLGRGETETILEAEVEDCYAVLNDQRSRVCASHRGVKHITLEILLLELFSYEIMTSEEFEQKARLLASVSGMRAERMAELLELRRMIEGMRGGRGKNNRAMKRK